MSADAHWSMDGNWKGKVRNGVEHCLKEFLSQELESHHELPASTRELVRVVQDLTLRGGKRMRPMVTAAAMHAVNPTAPLEPMYAVGAALELLQSYFLIHDDWMDGDVERRGGPAVHTLYEQSLSPHDAASVAILAGDLAGAYAHEMLAKAPVNGDAMVRLLQAFTQMERDVIFGQELDLQGTEQVEAMYALKTGAYTVRGPTALGAILGGASPTEVGALCEFAHPAGVAFQLRDELLGTFGDPSQTGKPAGNDLRAGKVTCLVQYARAHVPPDSWNVVQNVLGRRDAPDGEINTAIRLLESCGARTHVEGRLGELTRASLGALENSPLDTALLSDMVSNLSQRSS